MLKKKSVRLFRGAASKNVFQTVDVGAGNGDYVLRQAKRHKKRRYVAVDPEYNDAIYVINKEAKGIMDNLHRAKVNVVKKNLRSFVDEMIASKKKTRHLNFDMPYELKEYDFDYLLSKVPNVLLPNGKIFIASNSKSVIRDAVKLAKKHGISARIKPSVQENGLRTGFMQRMTEIGIHKEIFRVELTYGLKKAFPGAVNVEKRRNWPR